MSFGASAVLFGGFTMLVYVLHLPIKPLCIIIAAMALGVSLFLFIRQKLYVELIKVDRFALIITVAVFFFAILFVALPGDMPSTNNADTTSSVKAPYLPSDPQIPYRTAQFILNDLDVNENQFYIDWFFSDRTPLMGAVTAFFEATLDQDVPPEQVWGLPGRAWQLIDQDGYWLYRLIASLLSSIFLLPTYLLAKKFFGDGIAKATLLFIVINPFIVINTFFTWPKLMMAYFLLVAFYFIAEHKLYTLSGASLAFAYLSHPLAALYLGGAFVYIFLETFFKSQTFRRWASLLGGFFFAASPWLYWTMFVYKHPSRMSTYPIGYIIKDPTNANEEIKYAWEMFRRRPVISILMDRFKIAYDTLMPPLDIIPRIGSAVRGIFQGGSWRDALEPLHGPVVTLHYSALPGMLGLALWFFTYYGVFACLRRYYRYIISFLVVPFMCVLIFWGVWPRGVGMDVLQPMIPMIVPFGIYGVFLIAEKRLLVSVIVVFVVLEYMLVMWLGLGYFKISQLLANWEPTTIIIFLLVAIWYVVFGLICFYTIPKLEKPELLHT